MSHIPERVFGIMSNYVLLAVPFFIFMGTMLEKSKLAEDLLTTIGALFGRCAVDWPWPWCSWVHCLPRQPVWWARALLPWDSFPLPVMHRYGYAPWLSTEVIAASGTLGQIIPPSVVLIVLADQLGISVGDLFIGSLVPGMMLASMFAIFVLIVAWFKPEAAPALPPSERTERGQPPQARDVCHGSPAGVDSLGSGEYFHGRGHPHGSGCTGRSGRDGLAAFNGRLNKEALHGAMDETTRLTAMVMFLLIGSTAFALVFRGLYGDIWIEDLLTNLPGGKIGLLIVANLTIFILGFFIDFFEIAFIILPLLCARGAAFWESISFGSVS